MLFIPIPAKLVNFFDSPDRKCRLANMCREKLRRLKNRCTKNWKLEIGNSLVEERVKYFCAFYCALMNLKNIDLSNFTNILWLPNGCKMA